MPGITGRLKRASSCRDESSQLTSAAVAFKNSLITYNDQVNQIPLSPLDNLANLALCPRGTTTRDIDANDHAEAVSAARSANILEAIAISGVDANNLKSLASNISNVSLNGALVLAAALRCVWRVGHPITGSIANLAVWVRRWLWRIATRRVWNWSCS